MHDCFGKMPLPASCRLECKKFEIIYLFFTLKDKVDDNRWHRTRNYTSDIYVDEFRTEYANNPNKKRGNIL